MKYIRSMLALFVILISATSLWGDTSLQKVNRILEKWTSVHWGNDCFVWIAHYPRELIDPWVDVEAEKNGMTQDERARYKQVFADELKPDENEVFLFSIYYFGQGSMDLSPLSDKIRIEGDETDKQGPSFYDPVLDSPIKGVVQGLVFFPKQKGNSFELFVRGLGIADQAVFPFPVGYGSMERNVQEHSEERVPVTKTGVIVMSSNRAGQTPPVESEAVIQNSLEVFSGDDVSQDIPSIGEYEDRKLKVSSADGLTKAEVLSKFLDSWMKGDYIAMYGLLSEESRRKYSETSFKAGAMQSPFRLVLRDGYDIRWIDNTHAEVVVKADLMLMPSLKKKVFELVEMSDVWRIAW